MSESFRALIIGDKFIPTDSYAEYLNGNGIPTSYVDWEGTKAEQHALQQVTEFKGVNAPGRRTRRRSPRPALRPDHGRADRQST
jgi:hypothetical protein